MNINKLDWESEEPIILINPRMPVYEKIKMEQMIKEYQLKNHIFLATSGSTAVESIEVKWVALKKELFLESAREINKHLNTTQKDIFLNTLPLFHVAGLANFAKALTCGANIINIHNESFKWNSESCVDYISEKNVTIISLVPSQLYDIVLRNLKAPPSLKVVVVGGGFLSKDLYTHAQNLNWPILPSYGMTECCSQVATALPDFKWHGEYPELTILPHFKITFSPEGNIIISGKSLLTGYILQTENKVQFIDPKVENKIFTHDLGQGENGKLIVYGRSDENIKISGENVSLLRLQNILEQSKQNCNLVRDGIITSIPDPRQGFKIVAVFAEYEASEDEKNKIYEAISYYNEKVYPFERITKVHFVKKIPRTELGKLKRKQLYEMIKPE